MDIRSLLNDQAPAAAQAHQHHPHAHIHHPHAQRQALAPIDNACQPASWHDGPAKHGLRTLLCNEPVVRKDSMSYSPTSEPSRRFSTFDNLPKTLPCYQCDKRFSRRSDLVRHERIHSGVRPHSCRWPRCGKAFIQRSALTIHERVHTKEKPHVCLQCEKPFSDSSSLARHRRTHTGVRPYHCDFPGCGKDFTRKTTLSRHRQQHITKRHVPAGDAASLPSATASMSTVSSYGDLATPRTASDAQSPSLMKMNPQGSYITFQINQPGEERDRYDQHRPSYSSAPHPQQQQQHSQAHLQPRDSHHARSLELPLFRSASYSDERSLAPPPPGRGSALLSPPADYHPRHGSTAEGGDYFARPRPSLPASRSSYSGEPLPRIVAGWSDEQPQYGPISSAEESHARERRDSAVAPSRPFWSPC